MNTVYSAFRVRVFRVPRVAFLNDGVVSMSASCHSGGSATKPIVYHFSEKSPCDRGNHGGIAPTVIWMADG